jgi:hypothetical protein
MNKNVLLATAALAFGAFLNAHAAPQGTVPKAEQKKSSRPAAQEPERDIPYEEVAKFKGQRIIVHSTIGTTRSGTLTKYSGTQIDIALDGNGLQFTFLREAIKSIGIPITPDPAPGDDSAKKN